MTKRKMNTLIALGIIALYIVCLVISFNTCYSLEATKFTNDSQAIVDGSYSAIQDIENNTEYRANTIDELSQQLLVLTNGFYPYVYAVFDENGETVIKSGTYLGSDYFGKYIYIDDYFTDDLKKQYYEFDESIKSYPEIYQFDFYEDENGYIPVKMYLCSHDPYADGDKSTAITFSYIEPNKVLKNSDEIYFTLLLSDEYRFFDPVYKKIREELNSSISDEKMLETVKNEVQISNGGGGYYGSDCSEQHAVFTLEGKTYYYYMKVEHSIFYDTLISYSFSSNLLNQSILFGIVAIVLFVIANKLYNKNKQINDTREAFTSAAAHELKTPITIINNQCECLIKNIAPEKQEKYISTIYKQNSHMSHLVGNLLQYNRLSTANIEKAEFDLAEVVKDELEKYEALIEQKEIALKSNLTKTVINGDKDLITLVVDNYISNAVKHTEKGKMIKVVLLSIDGFNKLTVFNEGHGIKEEYRNQIWEIFNRSYDGSTHDNSTGMGLAISKKILDLHKYKYGFENKPKGVEFYFIAK